MINLKKLALYFVAHSGKTFIDGNTLKKNIINHMPRLNEFIFNICSIIPRNQMHLLSNENIHRTFTSFKNYKVITCVDYFPKKRSGQYHIYSYPYPSTHYDNITNNFPGGLFNNIEGITLFGARPFEEEFFQLLNILILLHFVCLMFIMIILSNFYLIQRYVYQIIFNYRLSMDNWNV